MYKTVDETPEDRLASIRAFTQIQCDLQILETAIAAGEKDSKEAVKLNRELVVALLKMAKSDTVRGDLKMDDDDVAKLEWSGQMPKEVRIKFRIYVEEFLRKNDGLPLPSRGRHLP